MLTPFYYQEIQDKGGQYYGQHALTKSLIKCDRSLLQNPHSWISGVSGSGKSLAAKFQIAQLILSTDDDVIVLDPENEYSQLISSMGGVTVEISASSKNHINALDLSREYGGGGDPIIAKSEFVLSLCEQIIKHELSAKEMSVIDRCTRDIYEDYKRDFRGAAPTFADFYETLLRQPEQEAKDIALAIEMFTKGSLSVFSKPTNVDIGGRVMAFNLHNLGKQLMNVGMLVTLDSVLIRVSANKESGRRTHIFIDVMHIYFRNEHSAIFFDNAWKRFRKYNGYLTGLTQNVREVLEHPLGRFMLDNSEFLILLNQSQNDRRELAEVLSIPTEQLSYITNSEAGNGLMRIGKAIVPFKNDIPTETELYRLITTRPGEG